jgi:hypothetical protein
MKGQRRLSKRKSEFWLTMNFLDALERSGHKGPALWYARRAVQYLSKSERNRATLKRFIRYLERKGKSRQPRSR